MAVMGVFLLAETTTILQDGVVPVTHSHPTREGAEVGLALHLDDMIRA